MVVHEGWCIVMWAAVIVICLTVTLVPEMTLFEVLYLWCEGHAPPVSHSGSSPSSFLTSGAVSQSFGMCWVPGCILMEAATFRRWFGRIQVYLEILQI